LSGDAMRSADAVLTVRMTDLKGSMNVGVACGIALHAWYVQAQLTDLDD
jgi:tRNA G18 (ribose-2'-O)-methylase SpoU